VLILILTHLWKRI